MVYSLTWLPEVIDRARIKYSEYPEWRTRGRGEMGLVRGVIVHHTAGSRNYNMPSLDLLVRGRPDLNGPLAHLGLGRDGTFYIIAAGRANHAGAGKWRGISTGNSNFIGIEVENHGTADDPYPEEQMDALRRGVAAILAKVGADSSMVCGHREYAPGRKIDPLWDMPSFREQVAALMAGGVPPATPIPASDPQARPTLRRGVRGPFVTSLQTALGINPPTGNFGPITEARLRAWQRERKLVPDGIAGPKTWAMLDLGGNQTLQVPLAAAAPNSPQGAQTASQTTLLSALAVTSDDIPPAEDAQHKASSDGRNAFGPDGRRFASRVKAGFMTSGLTGIDAFVATHPEAAAGLTPSTLRALSAVKGNEGNLEAVNSYDNAFLSFGIMQWTAGAAGGKGELGAFLSRLKAMDAGIYQAYFGQYGLQPDAASGEMYGGLLLTGTALISAALKAPLRRVDWAYRFWRAGHDPVVRHCEILHAGGRIAHFANAPVEGHPAHLWFSSELGMALLLDQHVNRPGHVPGTLERAIKSLLATRAVSPDPATWTDSDEDRLIQRYVALRAGTSMTHSGARAARLLELAHAGELSTARGSFA